MDLWQYRARVDRIVDGDTLDLVIDLGFGVRLTGDEARVRLRNIDTAETYGVSKDSEEYATGTRHKAFVEEWVARADAEVDDEEWPLFVQTEKDDERGKYGRWLAVIHRRSDGAVLNDDLVTEFGDVVRS
jgi:micrococcal nuclease